MILYNFLMVHLENKGTIKDNFHYSTTLIVRFKNIAFNLYKQHHKS